MNSATFTPTPSPRRYPDPTPKITAGGDNRELPLVAISACLLGQPVRYDGHHKAVPELVSSIEDAATLVPICPEMAADLGVPREPIDLVEVQGLCRVLGRCTGADYTEDLENAASSEVNRLLQLGIRGAVLKARSPSCECRKVEMWDRLRRLDNYSEKGDNRAAVRVYRSGIFASALRVLAPALPIASDEDLMVDGLRQEFFKIIVSGIKPMRRWI